MNDAAYGALTYDGYKPLSLFSAEGAMETGLEIHSLSKAFNMTGWRIGFICGNSKAIKAYATVKDNNSRRFDLLVAALKEEGFSAKKPKGTFYCYVKAPKGTESGREFNTASEFSEFLIKESLISTVPWDDAGKFIRFSVTFEADSLQKEKEVIEEMKKRLINLKLLF